MWCPRANDLAGNPCSCISDKIEVQQNAKIEKYNQTENENVNIIAFEMNYGAVPGKNCLGGWVGERFSIVTRSDE